MTETDDELVKRPRDFAAKHEGHEFDPHTERCIWCNQGRISSSEGCTAEHSYRDFLVNGNIWVKTPLHAPYITNFLVGRVKP